MYNLIKLECRKFKFKFVSIGTIVANLILLVLFFFFSFIGKVEQNPMCKSPEEWMVAINMFSLITFIIYGSTVLAKVVISEYRTKTIQLMFMYPIDRKKLLLGKTLIVYLFTMINLILTNAFLMISTCLVDLFYDIIPGTVTIQTFINTVPLTILCIISGGFLAIIPLYFGMRKKSTVHTIVAAIVVATITCSGMGNMSMSIYFIRILVIGVIAVISFFLTIRYALNQTDSIEMD